MTFCKNDFDTKDYNAVYEIDAPYRLGYFVKSTLQRVSDEKGMEALIGEVHGRDVPPGITRIGIALKNPDDYQALIRGLDEAVFARRLDDIEHAHGPAHPLARYQQQLDWKGTDDPETRAQFEGIISNEREAALQQAWEDWDQVRAQWSDAQQASLAKPKP